MTTQIGASVHVDPSQIRRSVTNGSATLTFGPWPTVNRVDVYLDDVATIDVVIAELVALRAEMTGDAPEAAADLCGFRWTGPDGLRHGCTRDDGHPGDERGHEAYTADGTRLTAADPCWRPADDLSAAADMTPAGAQPAPVLCAACDNEPATEGRFCEGCAPAMEMIGALEMCPRCGAENWGMTPDGRDECASCQWTAKPAQVSA